MKWITSSLSTYFHVEKHVKNDNEEELFMQWPDPYEINVSRFSTSDLEDCIGTLDDLSTLLEIFLIKY